jgi:hypothetical protein
LDDEIDEGFWLRYILGTWLRPVWKKSFRGKNRFGVQKTTFRKNRQNIGKKSANLKKYKNIHFFLTFETFKATIASNRQIAT